MRKLTTVLLVINLFCCNSVDASYFEVCKLTGKILSGYTKSDKESSFSFQVNNSEPTTCFKMTSYAPEVCSSYIDNTYEVKLGVSFKSNVAIGSRLEIIQIATDNSTTWLSVENCEI